MGWGVEDNGHVDGGAFLSTIFVFFELLRDVLAVLDARIGDWA